MYHLHSWSPITLALDRAIKSWQTCYRCADFNQTQLFPRKATAASISPAWNSFQGFKKIMLQWHNLARQFTGTTGTQPPHFLDAKLWSEFESNRAKHWKKKSLLTPADSPKEVLSKTSPVFCLASLPKSFLPEFPSLNTPLIVMLIFEIQMGRDGHASAQCFVLISC